MLCETIIEKVAHALCQANGHDPLKSVVAGQPYLLDGRQFAAVSEFNQPVALWTFYKDDAIAAINAVSDWIRISVLA